MTQTDSEYERARARALKKRKFRADAGAYLIVNTLLIVIWAITGFGYFWPAWVLAVWGVLLILGAWQTFYRQDVTEEEIQREIRKIR